MTKRRPSKRPRTMAEAVLISLSEAEVQTPTPQPLQETHASHGTLPSQATQPSDARQPSQAPQLSQSRHLTQPSSHDPAPDTTMKTRGRGCAKGMKKWDTGAKLHVMFDNNFEPLGEEGTLLKGQLGTIVRNPHRVPLTCLDWDAIPEDIKSTIWKEIEDYVVDCPEGFRPVVMRACKKLWKNHKGLTKKNFYTKHKDDPNILLKVPKRVLPDQWVELVSYWGTKAAMIIANRNLTNRGFCGPVHRTGRTPFYQIRHEMSALGENTDKMSVFTKTRDENDPDVQSVLTTEVRDKIFHEVLGEDGHGYCKTFGAGVPRSAVYGQYSSPSHASSSSIANEITKQVREATQEIEQRLTGEIEKRLTGEMEQRLAGEIERRLDQMFMAHVECMGAQMASFGSHGETNGTGQVPNVPSRQPIIRESVGDDYTQDGEQVAFTLPTLSP
ncbi:hypothetical protein Vadar_034165 [Vaccinium darrowii]|uniref:Uncharacterized protein n=1 Tax=Vaccinium darrowii TaxID=229202 RepID=A0ACB7X6H1_9ERIC|nr:hypothetical protein Vadar_034165 [Vaccinium darrowii]